MPHVPLGVSKKFAGKSAGGLYGDVIECLDWSTGQILDTLRKLGLDSNTIVIYTSQTFDRIGFILEELQPRSRHGVT